MRHNESMHKRLLAVLLAFSLTVSGSMGLQREQASAAKTAKVTKLTLRKPAVKTLALKKGESYRLKWQVKPAKGKVTFTSGKKSVATVNKKGVIKAKKPGKATITIASKSKPVKKVKIKVSVYKKFKKVSKVKLTAPAASVAVGQTVKLTASVNPSKATVRGVSFVSADKKIAAVNSKGVVTGKKKGTATITAYAKDGRGAKASIKIAVTDGAKEPTVTPGNAGGKPTSTATPTSTPTRRPTASPTPTVTPRPTMGPELEQGEPGNFIIADGGSSAEIYVDKKGADYEGLSLVAESFCLDVNAVSSKGAFPFVVDEASEMRQSAIIAGSIGNNDVIDGLIADGRIDISDIKGKRETYKIQVVENPVANVKSALVIVGTDKRGTIYGIYHISEKMGVSPWIYWGDVMPSQSEKISFANDSYAYTSKEPSVKYRGIFLNDEAPSLTGWVKKNFKNYNELFYKNVFELILRCKGNYLWPAMWSNVFSNDGKSSKIANAELADTYGIVMGTSHHEPLCRAGNEWQSNYRKYSSSNAWDFNKNEVGITNFWRDGVTRNKAFENVYTLGMRGEADSALGGTVADNIDLLKRVITTQKDILKENNLQDAPQVLTVYKEVEEFWHGNAQTPGLKKWDALDDVTIMLCDDNFGNMRTLPEGADINRKGGWGMYYHFDYHGGPTSYEWLNTVQLDKVWEQMTMAYEHGIDDIWIVNVGDLKPMEMNISYFLDLAYDYDTWGRNLDNTTDVYLEKWVGQQFGSALDKEQQKKVQQLLEDYTWLNGTCKPEVVSYSTYDTVNYNEAQGMLSRIEDMTARAKECQAWIPERLQAAYFELVYFPVTASANVAKMQICSGLNRYYFANKSTAANLYADMMEASIELDKELQETYNKNMPGVGDKWDKMMSSPHVGYTNWDSSGWKYPSATNRRVNTTEAAKMSVYVEDKDGMLTEGSATLDDLTSINQESYTVTLSNQGSGSYDYTVTADKDWIRISKRSGTVEMLDTFEVSADWSKLTADQTGSVVIQSGNNKVTLTVNAKVYDTAELPEKTYVYANGYAAILPGCYTGKQDNEEGASVIEIDGYGRMGDAVKIQPADKRYAQDVSKAPYVEYSVCLPEAGDYKVTVYSAPSNNLERDDVGIYYGLSANGGEVQKINTILPNFVPGEYNNSWPNDVKNNGRVTENTMALEAGVNTIRIYAADPAFVLQKLVVSKESVKKSFLGPKESFYVGKQ